MSSADPAYVVMIQNDPGSGPGRLPEWFEAAGVEARLVPGAALPERLADFGRLPSFGRPVDGIVMLGGGFMPDDDERAPWLARERALAAEALAAGLPLLGICLGAQLLALVAGGTVTAKSGETEKGVCRIALLPEAYDDPLLRGLPELTDDGALRMVESHQDSITALPPGARQLATSSGCRVQAYRMGEAAWGLQFHPEADPERIARWDEAGLAALGYDRAALVRTARLEAGVNARQAAAIGAAFARIVRAGRTGRG